MTRIYFFFIFFSLIHISLSANVRVLSIGISEYPESSGWNKINAHNDVELIESLFPNTVSLENSEATRSKIERQLKALATNVTQGDTVIIHFSGHGQQIITAASVKEADGVDEALVPFDARKRETPSYHGENHFTDDAFGYVIDNLRLATGPNGLVIAIVDACHSDSMDKGADESEEIYRGTYEIFGSENMSAEKKDSLRDTYHNQDATTLEISDDMSDVIYISACKSDQRNYEVTANGQGYGSLTYYFCEAYKSNGLSDLPALLSAIYFGMENDQTLKFHGQVPSIRNTIGWVAPTKIPKSTKNTVTGDPPPNPTAIWGIIGVVFIVIFISLWIARKKKK